MKTVRPLLPEIKTSGNEAAPGLAASPVEPGASDNELRHFSAVISHYIGVTVAVPVSRIINALSWGYYRFRIVRMTVY